MNKAMMMVTIAILGLGSLAQAKDGAEFDINTIRCHGSGIEINMQNGTVSSAELGLNNVRLQMSLGSDKYERTVLRGKAPGITLSAAPDNNPGWAGNANSKITINGKTTLFECHVD